MIDNGSNSKYFLMTSAGDRVTLDVLLETLQTAKLNWFFKLKNLDVKFNNHKSFTL